MTDDAKQEAWREYVNGMGEEETDLRLLRSHGFAQGWEARGEHGREKYDRLVSVAREILASLKIDPTPVIVETARRYRAFEALAAAVAEIGGDDGG